VPLTARPDYQAGDGGRPNLSKGQMIGFVFAFVADVHPRWHTDVLEAQLTSGTVVADGTTFTIRFKPFMGMSEGTGIVTAASSV
jgi:hypothetical protein